MTTQEYCRRVEQAERRHRALAAAVEIRDDGSALVSLQESGFDLMFEPSMMDGYAYRVREAVHGKVGRIAQCLAEQDKVLIIRSAWRSFAHQRRLWERKIAVMQQEHPARSAAEVRQIVSHFIAPPSKSMHATGGAVDALIGDARSGRVMDFGNNEGLTLALDETCYPDHPDISPEARRNRQLLIGLFAEEGFVGDLLEYWHFDYGNAGWAARNGMAYARYGVIGDWSEGPG